MHALLTERERDILRRDDNVSPNYLHTVRSRVRSRVRELELDAEILSEYEPELFEMLQQVIEVHRQNGSS